MKRILLAVVLAAWSVVAGAQQFPAKPISLIVTFAAGGAMDLTARSMAAAMSESFGQVIVENRTGGGGLIGTDYVARAAPDGYTLLMFADVNVIAPAVYPKLNHDPIKDFAPITNSILGTHLIVAHPSLKANTLKELIELAKREPGKLTFGSPGTATPQHLAGELFKQQAGGLQIEHVPYRGGGQLITDLVGGQIPLGLIGLPPTLPHIKAGKLKVFAVTARKRSPSLPDVPTVEEAGLPGYETVQWFGPVAPAGTPRPVIDRLHTEFVKALRNPTIGERLKAAGLEVAPSASPEAYAQFIKAEYDALAGDRQSRGDGSQDSVNVLFITSDQQRGDCYGFEGRKVKTPHLDAMARAGTRFSACITPNLVCQPSRASILTGMLPGTHGVSDNGIDLDPKVGAAGFAGAFAKAGYRTGYIGKAHFATSHTFKPTGTPECRNSDQDPDWTGPYMGFEHVELMVEGHNHWPPMKPPRGQHYERWFHKDGRGEALQKLYETQLEPRSSAMQTFHSALPVAFHNSTWIGDRTIDFLKNHSREKFCIWASFPDPHHPFDAPEPWSRLHHPDEVDLPPERTLDLERRPWWHRQSLEGKPQIVEHLRKIREQYSRIPVHTDQQLRELMANYYGMISLIDHNVGRILLELESLGIQDDTLVVYSTDHGDWLGDHGLILKGPMPYEGLLRVGMLFQGPGVPKGKVVDDPVSTLDLPATFADFAGVGFSPLHSKSLKGMIQGKGGRDFAYSEWDLRASRSGVDLDLRTVRTRRHKLTLDLKSGAGELYDLHDDPHEMNNLFGKSETVQKQLTDMIRSRPADAVPRQPQVGMA